MNKTIKYKPLRFNKAELHLTTVFESDDIGRPMVAIDFISAYQEVDKTSYPQLSLVPKTITKRVFNLLVENMRKALTEQGVLVEENKEEL